MEISTAVIHAITVCNKNHIAVIDFISLYLRHPSARRKINLALCSAVQACVQQSLNALQWISASITTLKDLMGFQVLSDIEHNGLGCTHTSI